MPYLSTILFMIVLTACGGSSDAAKRSTLEPEDAGKQRDAATEQADASAGKRDAGAQRDAGKPKTAELALPTAVCTVLQTNGCLSCHRTPSENAAPMPLVRPDDFHADAKSGSVGERVLARIQQADDPMPPVSSGRPMMSDGDAKILEDWIRGGMAGVDGEACDPHVEPTGPVVPEPTPQWATEPWPEGECDLVMTLGAHNELKPLAEDDSAYPISAAETDYHCFYEQVPWNDDVPRHAIALRARRDSADDQEFVHHLVVSAQDPLFDNSLAGNKPSFSGDHKHCDNPTGSTLAVWAPGSQNPISTPSDVGILLPGPGAYFELQIHYNNPHQKLGHASRVQYDVCVTTKARPETAGTFWLGYENANVQTITNANELLRLDNKGDGVATGECAAKTKGRILSIMPHMHEVGKYAKVDLIRKDGSTVSLVDQPFNFENQYSVFKANLWVEPGDKIVSRCEWSKSPVYFGFGSKDEMCFFYTLAYPLDTFKPDPTPILGEKGIVGGNLACAGKAGP